MEAIRKQASKLREQVAKQQQAVFKQITGRFGHDFSLVDESELQCHQKLQTLNASTKAAKRLQRDIVRGVEAYIAISSKQVEIVKKLAEDCCKYGTEYQDLGYPLASATLDFGTSHILMEKERDNLLRMLGDQVYEPIRTMIMAAPLEDGRFLTYRYERIRQDVEAQTAEVVRRQLKFKDVGETADVSAKLQNAESKLSELKTTLSALGREATAAMMAVESQQQQITFEGLLAMVEAERMYHHNVANILDKLHNEMVETKENNELLRHTATSEPVQSQSGKEDFKTSWSHSDPVTQTATTDAQTAMEDLKTRHFHDEVKKEAAKTEVVQSQAGREDFKSSQPHHESLTHTAITETVLSQTGKENYNTSPSEGESVTQTLPSIADSQHEVMTQDTITETMQTHTKDRDPQKIKPGYPAMNGQHPMYFVAQVIHPFDAQTDGELNLSVDDYVVVRQVAPNGWSEGECKGKAGWFPSAYVDRRDKAPASKVMDTHLLT